MRPFFVFRRESLFIPGCVQGAIIKLVCLCVCVTFVVFTDCHRCTNPIATNLGSMKARENGLTRGTCFVASRLELVAVAGLLWISWCVLGGADFSFFSGNIIFKFVHESSTRSLAARGQSSQRRLGEGAPTASQSAHRELAPTYPHHVHHVLCSHLRNMASSVDQ